MPQNQRTRLGCNVLSSSYLPARSRGLTSDGSEETSQEGELVESSPAGEPREPRAETQGLSEPRRRRLPASPHCGGGSCQHSQLRPML